MTTVDLTRPIDPVPLQLRALPNFKAMQMPVADRFRLSAPSQYEELPPFSERSTVADPADTPASARRHTLVIPKNALLSSPKWNRENSNSPNRGMHVVLTRSLLREGPISEGRPSAARAQIEEDLEDGQFQDADEHHDGHAERG